MISVVSYWFYITESESHSVMCDSLWLHGLYSPWNSPGQNTGVGTLSLLQGIFPTQGSNPGLPHCRWILYQLRHKGSPLYNLGAILFFNSSEENCDKYMPYLFIFFLYFFCFSSCYFLCLPINFVSCPSRFRRRAISSRKPFSDPCKVCPLCANTALCLPLS